MFRGDVVVLRAPRDARGHEQRGRRFGVVLQNDSLAALSTVIIAPTSTSAGPSSFRPEIEVLGERTRIIVDQLGAVSPTRLGATVGVLGRRDLAEAEDAISLVLDLRRV